MTAAEQVKRIEDQLAATPAGVKSVVVDGQTVSFDRAQAIEELDYWKRIAAKEAGKRKLFRGVDLGTAW